MVAEFEVIGGRKILTARRDLPDICDCCSQYIQRNERFFKSGRDCYHYRCFVMSKQRWKNKDESVR